MPQLHPSLSFCDLPDRHVFLDLPGDRYFSLDGDLAASWQAMLRGQATSSQEDALIARGLVARSGGSALLPCPPHIASRSALDMPRGRASLARAIGHGWSVVRMRRRLRRQSLIQVTGAFLRAKDSARCLRPSQTELASIAADFSRLDVLSTTLDQCLPRSLALGFHLARLGFRPELVMAVRLGPFSAHCWIECDGMLVNDRYERVRDYRPIRRL